MGDIAYVIDDLIEIIERDQMRTTCTKQNVISALDYNSCIYKHLTQFCYELAGDFRMIIAALDDIKQKHFEFKSHLNQSESVVEDFNIKLSSSQNEVYETRSALNSAMREVDHLRQLYRESQNEILRLNSRIKQRDDYINVASYPSRSFSTTYEYDSSPNRREGANEANSRLNFEYEGYSNLNDNQYYNSINNDHDFVSSIDGNYRNRFERGNRSEVGIGYGNQTERIRNLSSDYDNQINNINMTNYDSNRDYNYDYNAKPNKDLVGKDNKERSVIGKEEQDNLNEVDKKNDVNRSLYMKDNVNNSIDEKMKNDRLNKVLDPQLDANYIRQSNQNQNKIDQLNNNKLTSAQFQLQKKVDYEIQNDNLSKGISDKEKEQQQNEQQNQFEYHQQQQNQLQQQNQQHHLQKQYQQQEQENPQSNQMSNKINRVNNIVMQAFQNESTLQAIKSRLGDDFQQKITKSDVSDEYLSQVENILKEINQNQKEPPKRLLIASKGKKKLPSYGEINDPNWKKMKLKMQITNKTCPYKEYPRGWNSSKDYFVNNASAKGPMTKSPQKITNFSNC